MQIVILGPHRSGTSAVAGLVEMMGAYFGDDDARMAPRPDNPKGFWERNDVVAINDRILEGAGGSWCRVHTLDLDNVPAAERPCIQNDITQLIDELNAHRPWMIKDPRLCLTFPFWKEQLGNPVVLLVHRNPLEVASSLYRRNGLPLHAGLGLWEFYAKSAHAIAADLPGVSVFYDALLKDPVSFSSDLLMRLQELEVGGLAAPEPSMLEQFIDARMRHEFASPDLLDEYLSPGQREFWEGIESERTPPTRYKKRLLDISAAALRALSDFAEWEDALESVKLLERSRAEALERERELHAAELEGEQERREREIRTLEDWLQELIAASDAVFTSLRWRLGSGIARSVELLALRHGAPSARDQIDRIAAEFRVWRARQALEPGAGDPAPLSGPSGVPESAKISVRELITAMLRHPRVTLRLLNAQRIRNFFITCFKQPAHIRREIIRDYLGVYEQQPTGPGISRGKRRRPDTPIVFPETDSPEVSVIVPVFNEFDSTLSCLAALRENTSAVRYEVIIADDASTDETRDIEAYCRNIRIVRAEGNRGFVGNCNAAAAGAAGEWLFFLNNDAWVEQDCVTRLLELARRDTAAGIVGPKIIYPDGRLQEAGGIVWRDGSAWNYGRGDDPLRPEYNYVREVDYISGAAILVRRELWKAAGGFDKRFEPAYYEDTDLAFQARSRGFKVVYQPEAVVTHEEGGSHGTDESRDVKQHQTANRDVFRDKWRAELEQSHFPPGEDVFRARERGARESTILVIDQYVPEFDKDAGSRSTLQYLRLFIERGACVKFLPDNFNKREPYTSTLQQMGIEVLYGDWCARNWIRWWRQNRKYFDVVYLHRPHIAKGYIDQVRQTANVKTIFFGHDLHYLRLERQIEVTNDASLRREAKEWRDLEYGIIGKSDVVYYPSASEVAEVRNRFPEKTIRAIPLNIYEVTEDMAPGFAERADLFFIGGFRHPPNLDGVFWLIEEVLPRVVERIPGARLIVAGSRMPEEVVALAGEHVAIKGSVSERELEDLYARARVVVVPLRFGAGVKGKVLEAMRHRVPVVTTSVGAEGLPEPVDYLEVVDEAGDFAQRVIEVYNDADKWRRLSEGGATVIEKHFSKSNAFNVVARDFEFDVDEEGASN